MFFLLTLSILICLLYGGMLWYYFPQAFAKKDRLDQPNPFVSVLVPARNEGSYVQECLQALTDQNYPEDRFEILLIDDHSEDNTTSIVQAFAEKKTNIHLLFLRDFLKGETVLAHKKAALQYGVQEAKGEFILSTDADCKVSKDWIRSMTATGNDFVLGPVRIECVTNLLSAFQALDICGVMMLTAGSAQKGQALLANGANLGFRRKLFLDINGYEGVDHLASGDDVLLLQKVHHGSTAKIEFVTQIQAMVYTLPETSWSALWKQRLRWAGKTGAYTDYRLIIVQAISFTICWAAIILLLLPLLRNGIGYFPALILWGTKMIIDFFWLRAACNRFGESQWIRWFIPAFFLHTLYVAIIGMAALLPIQTKWKGRKLGR